MREEITKFIQHSLANNKLDCLFQNGLGNK